jgi:hypothetical protein
MVKAVSQTLPQRLEAGLDQDLVTMEERPGNCLT